MTVSGKLLSLSLVSVALVLAFLFAPAAVLGVGYPQYRDVSVVGETLRVGFVLFWRNGSGTLPPELEDLVDYWFRWHAVKIVISTCLTVALTALAATLWRTYLRGRSRAVMITAALVTVAAATSVIQILANVQSTVAPMVALLPFLSGEHDNPALAQTFGEMRRAADDSPAIALLADRVGRYNWAMIVSASVVGTVSAAASVVAGKRCRAGDRTMYSTIAAVGVVTTVAMLGLIIEAALAVADPRAALLGMVGA